MKSLLKREAAKLNTSGLIYFDLQIEKMEVSGQKFKCDLKEAANIVLQRQGLATISEFQFFQLECIVTRENSLHQLPTGSGKTWAAIRKTTIFTIYFGCFRNHLVEWL